MIPKSILITAQKSIDFFSGSIIFSSVNWCSTNFWQSQCPRFCFYENI